MRQGRRTRLLLLLLPTFSPLLAADSPAQPGLISPQISCTYPTLAKQMHVEGAVQVELTASPDTSGVKVHAISGHPLLKLSAEECVARWRSSSKTRPDHGTVQVVFRMGQ